MEVVEENCTTVVTVEKIEKKKTKKSKSSKNSMKKSFSKFDALQKKPENEQPEQKICQVCEKPVYKMEEILIKKKISFHRNCFKCVECRKPLTADFFQSEDGTLYCSIHWKKKFEKRIDDEEKENGTTPLRKTELIIRESNPVPLPPDVVRSSEKSSLGLEDLEKRNNRNIRSRFENGWNEKIAKMEDDEDDDSEFENDENEDNENRRQPKFSQMSEFREKFEHGTKEDLKEERRESRKMELQNIRSRLFFGKQARIKEMYQQAVKESSESTKKEIPEDDLKEITVNTQAKKSMFENGDIFRKSKIERTDSCDIEVIENGLGKKSRNIFKEMEVENHTNNVSNFTKPKVSIPKKEVEESKEEQKPADIVRSSRSPTPELDISSKNVSSAYEFFSTLSTKKEIPEEKKRKEIGIGKSQTTTKMLSRFRELEQKKSDDEREIKPLKEFTPERETGRRYRSSDSDSEEEDSESEEDRMQREEDRDLIEARQLARAKHLREKFEKWDNAEQSFERERENEALLQERDHLIGLLNEKTRETDSLRQKILELERGTAANRDLHGKLALLAAENERLNNVLTEISNELDGFRKKFNELGDLETRLAMLLIEKERLTQERERLLRELEALRLKAQEADRLNVVVIERSRENDELKTKNAAIPHLEVRVNQSEQDREALKRALADRDRIINELRLRISQLENEALVINDLKGKLVLLAAENERLHQDKERELSILRAENQRLNLLILEKIKIIEEWENKYHVLEELYLNVRETTEHLNIVKQKYDNAVNLTEQSEPRLRLSIDAKQRKSISSEVRPIIQTTYETSRVHTTY